MTNNTKQELKDIINLVESLDEHTAIAKWESETKEEFNDLLGGNIEPISIGYKPDLNNDS